MHTVDWTNAWIGRMSDAPKTVAPGAADAAAARLAAELAERHLPFLHLAYRDKLERDMQKAMPRLKPFKHMLLLGIGGSALGARALQKALYPQQDRPGHSGRCLWIADNVDADTLNAWFSRLDPLETLVVPVSKSGGTIETVAQYFLAKAWLQAAVGDAWHEHLVFVTDAAKGFFREEANRYNIPALDVPDHLGGRYSVLSAVGLVPAAFLGLDWMGLLDGASSVARPLANHPAGVGTSLPWKIAHWAVTLAERHYSQLIFFGYIPLWSCFGAWFSQLWAESLGKNGKGTMPLPAVGVTDQHSLQQMFLDGPRDKGCLFLTSPNLDKGRAFPEDLPPAWTWLQGRHFGDLLQAEALGTSMAMTQRDVPLLQIRLDRTDAHAAGALMTLLMAATVFSGWMLEIDPLDQPAVELGKQLANARLGAPGYDDKVAALDQFLKAQTWDDTF